MKRSITLFCTLLLLIVSAVPAFAGKVLAEIEYFYSDDGTLVGKAFNGKRVNFEYDLRGQLLAVKDASGKDLERYTYDPAGNRLSKTINGVTTTYTYDKANQLVTSTVNGVTTHYKYDAAGRMIQAGDKKYIYNGNNKVVAIWQNGDIIAKFEYNIDGQIAKAIYGDKVEEFMWDGLALIWRSGVTYINEPYVTGGNPVMAGDDVLFNDMLGSTLAVNDKAVEMTSFGETADKNAFFTGKPMIDELGYSFLFRDYNPNQGKWTTTDPLGYPDGWNNLAYCNNSVTIAFDWLGSKIVIRGSEQYIQNVKNLIVKLISTPSGKLVYDFLSNSERTHCIVEGNLNDSAFAHNVGQPSDTTIVFSAKPRTEGDFVSPAWAVLGHEMNHSFFFDRGIYWDNSPENFINGIFIAEILACTEENRIILENNPEAMVRTTYNGRRLPDSAIRPETRKFE